MSKELIYLMSFVLVLAMTPTATPDQRTITIDNPGFEDPVLGEDDYTWLDVPGWTWVGGEGPGVWHVTSADFDPVLAPEGQNVLYTENAVGDAGGVAQVLTETFAANRDYTLTVEVGNSWYYYFSGYSVQLLAGGVVIAEDNDTLWPDYYTWATSTVHYTYDSADSALVGQPLEIRLLTLALDKDNPPAGEVVGVEFDNVTLSYDYDPAMATNPSPADGATDVCRKPVLSWTPGKFAAPTNGHKVYFGESFNEINDATGGVAQDATSYTLPQRLDFATTYYWRVDEVNAPPTSHIEFKGNVWSFTTEPVGYPIDGNNIAATASSSDAGQGPENTVNRSGLDANDLHSIELTDMWLSGEESPGQAWIEYEFDKVYKLHQMWVWNHNTNYEVWVGFGFKDVTIEYSTNGTDWTVLAGVTEFAQGTGSPDYAHNAPVDFDGVVAKYVKITADSNWSAGRTTQYGLSEVRFFCIPVQARYPNPMDEATGVGPDVILSWRAGREAAEHNVYLNTDEQAVINGTAPVTNIPAAGECLASHDAGTLELGKTYYWKITEVNMAETPTTWEGDVWSFATPEYLVVEDFEDYNDFEPDRIFETWKGGYGYTGYCGNGTGSAVGHPSYPYAEQTIVHGGSQSMPFYYDNSATGTNSCGQPINLYYSETERTFDTPQDWTKAGVKALTLYFQGDPNNTAGATERIYVKVNGAKVLYDGDMADIKQAGWHEWNIDLASFGGVNLQNVTKVNIGLGNGTGPGGSGVVYFDDIRLYPARCVPDRKEPPAADLNNDCKVDYKELEVMAANWLAVAVAPSNANLVGWWKLDGNANDSAGINHGTLMGDPQWVSEGYDGGALDFDGSGDYVDIGYSPELSLNDFTVSAWVNIAAEPGLFGVLGTRVGGDQTFDFKVRATNVHGDIGDGTNWLNTSIDIESNHTGTTGQGGDLSVDTWYVITYVIDNTNQQVRLYLDGDLKRTIAISGTPLLMKAGQSMRIGHTGTGTEWMNGLIDDVRIYNMVLTDVEILGLALRTDLYEDMKIDFKDFAELAVWWLDEQLWP